MNKIILSLALAGFASAPTLAQQSMTFADVDTDGSGELSLTELQVAWPDIAQAEFDNGDVDASGGLSVAELNSLQSTATPVAPEADTPAPAGNLPSG